MSGRSGRLILFGFVLSVSLIASVLTASFVSHGYRQHQYELLNAVCAGLARQEPEADKRIAAVLKEYTDAGIDGSDSSAADPRAAEDETGMNPDFLAGLGYRVSDFAPLSDPQGFLAAAAGALAGVLLFGIVFFFRNKWESLRIQALTGYLAQANAGRAAIFATSGEDDFSKLEDQIYKTVTHLYQTRDAAVQAKNEFAENLSNIAHQIKTPITALSLCVQTMRKGYDGRQAEQMQKQLMRLTHLQESLLLLARLDAGVLDLQRKETDVFTLLALAADNLQELLEESGCSVDLPELGETAVTADLDWTMEAVMNLMKNCMEHNPGGVIHCSYGQNPLYTEILIRDEGDGFAREDLPHLFERFYRGKHAAEGGIGIGLALAKEIIERQNGTIRAKNMCGGGACFEIRLYRH